jgi:DNA-binding beta-propeller fold protein YncE
MRDQMKKIGAAGSLLLLSAAVSITALTASASAASRAYWADSGANRISFANLDGSGAGDLNTTGTATLNEPYGVALDLTRGKIYWTNGSGNTISFANLDGSGASANLSTAPITPSNPQGLTIDPALGKIFWSNANGANANQISFANLDGGGGGNLNTGAASTPDNPTGPAFDSATGRIYWANYLSNKLSYANADNSGGGGDLNTAGAVVDHPQGVSIDPVSRRIYWTNTGTDSNIWFANLDNSGGGPLNESGTMQPAYPVGTAIDPFAGRIYWMNNGTGVNFFLSSARLNGTGGGVDTPLAGPTPSVSFPYYPALLETPNGTKAPVISGKAKPGATLSCSDAAWSPDLIGAALYDQPRSISRQPLRNGNPIPGASSSSFKAHKAGAYSCRETASNQAGSTDQLSEAIDIITFGKTKLNPRNGTARLFVSVPSTGVLALKGKGVVRQRERPVRAGADRKKVKKGTVKLLIKPKGKVKHKLLRRGRARIKVKVTFTPKTGAGATLRKSIKLIQRPRAVKSP